MKFLYYVVFVAVCVFYASAKHNFAYRDIRVAADGPYDEKVCTRPGLLCTNCTKLVNCVYGEDGRYDQVEVQSCSNGQTCLRDHCTTEYNPVCVTDFKFECTATGVFPDPFNCRKYHYCVEKHSDSNDIQIEKGSVGITTLLCDPYHSYDPITTYCKNNLYDGCPDDFFPVPECKSTGQTGALSNKSLYYVCVVSASEHLIPKLFVCPHGKIYNNSRCA